MARFKIGDRVKVIITIGSIYNKAGTIIGYAQVQCERAGQCYTVPNWKVQLDSGEFISVSEKYLNQDKRGRA